MTESRKIQLISEVDATGAKKGLGEITEAAKRTADDVSKVGKDGAKGLDGINEAGKKLGDGLKRIGREGSDGLRKIPEEANKGAAGIDRATRTIISQIQRTTATLEAGERGTRSYYEAIAKQRGISNEALRPYLEQLEAVRGKQVQATTAAVAGAAGLKTVGVSAAQTAAALRQVPAQLTDIVVGLQAGQAPMTVLLQQGGQLKDMFGGIAPAARALGGAVLGMVNPFTLAAGAAAALAVAYNQGANEAQRYREVLIRSNGAIGVTADQLGAMARRISEVGGTQGQAAAALAEFAGSARVAREDLERFSAAAASLQRVAGVPIAETRKQFEELGKAPAEALLKLNEGTNFLTGALYEQVRALEQQGRTVEAARIAQAAWASETERVVAGMEANLGLLERGWRGITSAAKSAWDAMLAVGRESSANDRIQAQVDLVKQLERELASVEARGLPGAQALRGQIETIKQQIASARQVVQLEAEAAASKAKTVEQEQAKLRWAAEGVKFLSDQKKLEQEIAQIRTQGAAAGASLAEIEGRVAKVRERFAQATKAVAEETKRLKAEQKGLNDLIADALDRDKQRQKVLDDTAARELDRLRQQEARQAAADQAAKSAADMQRAIEFETQALQMSNVEREIAVAMLKLEEQGIVAGTAAYEAYAEAIRGAIVDRDAVRRSVEQTKEIQREYEQMSDQIGQSLSDALMNGGKSAADYLKGLFRNLVLQPILRPVGNAIAGAVTGFAPGAASAASAGSALGSLGALGGLTGAAGTFGSSFRYGLGALTGERSLTGLLGMGSDLFAGGLVDGLGTLAGALGPIALGAMAISKLFSGGETRAGGRYGMVDGQAAFLEGPSGGQVGPMAEAVQSAIDSINATLSAVGSQAAVSAFAAGVETSKNSRGGAFAGGALSTGATFGDTTDAVGWRYSENLDASDAGARFARELQMATIEALQAADLGGVIGRMVEGVDFSSMSDDALAGLSAQIQQTIASVTAFRESIAGLPMANLAGLSFDAAAALVEFSGGLESLQNNLGAYYQQFFSEEERVAALTGQLTAQLAALGFAMPETREGFRALVEAQDLTTAAGQRTYAALLGMADGFASVVPATEILTDVIGDVGGTVTDVAETVEQALARIRAEARAAEAIARNIIALEQQLYREQNFGDTAALRAQELDGLTAAEQALMRQIWAIQDAREAEAAAAQETARAAQEADANMRAAASAMQRIAQERYQLETRLLTLQGNTAELRARELAQLDPSNRALQEQIWALEDQAAAAQRAAQRTAQARSEWERLTDSIIDEVRRIRGEVAGDSSIGYAQAQAQFAVTRARAAAGDRSAMEMLPDLSRTLLELAEVNATTLVELQRIRAQTAGSLSTLPGIRVPAMATGTNYVPRDMLAMLHEGEAVVPKTYNPAAGGGSERELLAEMRAMNARLSRLEDQAVATSRNTERAARVLDDASRGKAPLVTEVAA